MNKLYMLERRRLPNGRWQEIGQYSTWRALQAAQKRDRRRPRSDPYEWQVTSLGAHDDNLAKRDDKE